MIVPAGVGITLSCVRERVVVISIGAEVELRLGSEGGVDGTGVCELFRELDVNE